MPITLKLCVVMLEQHKNPKQEGGMAGSGSGKGWSGAGRWERAEHRVMGTLGSVDGGPSPTSSMSWLSLWSQCHRVLPSWAQIDPWRFRFGVRGVPMCV